MMIDFTKAIEELNIYKGSEKKKTLIYDNKKYLVKFPDPIREKNRDISYINNAFSEYVGSNIFKLIGFDVQNTVLGKYIYNNKEKIVCGCEDFTDSNNSLYEFESLALSNNPDKKIGTELTDILEVIEDSKMIDTVVTKFKFYDMFVVDALIGNTDRHIGNWGFMLNHSTKEISFSPIYDCGSCLNPMLDDKDILVLDENEVKNLAINSYSCIKVDNKKINYITYIKSLVNDDCNSAICRVFPKININEINNFIDSISCMSSIRKEFYKGIIKVRYDILKDVYNTLCK